MHWGSVKERYQQAAWQYIRYGSFREALNVLGNARRRDGRWYYLSALANNGLGNQVTALEHIRRAVSMEPDNMEYIRALNEIEHGGAAYRRQAGNYGGYTMRGGSVFNMCMCLLAQMFCPNRALRYEGSISNGASLFVEHELNELWQNIQK